MGILKSILVLIELVMQWLVSPRRQRKADEADARKAAESAETERAKLETEVRTGDEDAVNARIGRTLRALAVAAVLGTLAAGCVRTNLRTTYVNEPDRVYRMAREGVPGWWVPDGVMVRLLGRAEGGKLKPE